VRWLAVGCLFVFVGASAWVLEGRLDCEWDRWSLVLLAMITAGSSVMGGVLAREG